MHRSDQNPSQKQADPLLAVRHTSRGAPRTMVPDNMTHWRSGRPLGPTDLSVRVRLRASGVLRIYKAAIKAGWSSGRSDRYKPPLPGEYLITQSRSQ